MNDLLTHLPPQSGSRQLILLVIQILVLSGKNKPISRAVGVAVGAGVMFGSQSCLPHTPLSGFGQTPAGVKPDDVNRRPENCYRSFWLFSAFATCSNVAVRRTRPELRNLPTQKWRAFVAVGPIIMLTNITTPCCSRLPFISITQAPVPRQTSSSLTQPRFFITMLPLLTPLGCHGRDGKNAAKFLLKAFTASSPKHNAVISATVCFAFAVYLGYMAIVPTCSRSVPAAIQPTHLTKLTRWLPRHEEAGVSSAFVPDHSLRPGVCDRATGVPESRSDVGGRPQVL